MADIIRDVEAGRAERLHGSDGRELIAASERLTALLLEDDRSGGAVAQLMKAMGEHRWLLSGSNTLWGAAKDSGAPKGLEEVHVPEHGWHSDNPGVFECWPRIKVMMYLRDTTKQGALRLIPGSHRPEYQEQLKPLMGWHGAGGPATYTPEYAEHTFGVQGVEVPSVAVEATVGDIVFFHHSMYHAVFNHAPDRRLLAYWFVGYPDSDTRLASLWRNDVTFTAGWRRNGDVWRGNTFAVAGAPESEGTRLGGAARGVGAVAGQGPGGPRCTSVPRRRDLHLPAGGGAPQANGDEAVALVWKVDDREALTYF